MESWYFRLVLLKQTQKSGFEISWGYTDCWPPCKISLILFFWKKGHLLAHTQNGLVSCISKSRDWVQSHEYIWVNNDVPPVKVEVTMVLWWIHLGPRPGLRTRRSSPRTELSMAIFNSSCLTRISLFKAKQKQIKAHGLPALQGTVWTLD